MRAAFLFLLVLMAKSALSDQAPAAKPKVRAITFFVRIDPHQYQAQLAKVLSLLQKAKAAYEQHGYEVETLRVTTQPFSELVRGMSEPQAIEFFHRLDAAAGNGGYIVSLGPAMSSASDSPATAELLARVLAENEQLNGNIIVAQQDGIHWNAVRAAAKVMKYLEDHTFQSGGNFRFAASAMLGPYDPFFPSSYFTGADHQFAVGLESADVVQAALAANPGNVSKAEPALADSLGRYLAECEQIGRGIEKDSGWMYAGIDPTPAPAGEVSIGDAIEKFTGNKFGSSGTMTAAALITRAVKSVLVKRVGFSGLMVPVLEDNILAERWSEGAYSIDSLLAYSAVCGTGLDTVPLPGDVSETQLAQIIGDMAILAYKWAKPLSARLLPVKGKKAGEKTDFNNPHLANAVLQKLP